MITSENEMQTNPGVLSGYRVLDFGWVLAGALPGMILADMGAEVIKVETRQRLDYMRMGRPIVGDQPDPEQNPMFHNVNRGKLSVTLNIGEPEAVELAKSLALRCDVVIENFSPGVMDRLGLGYEALCAPSSRTSSWRRFRPPGRRGRCVTCALTPRPSARCPAWTAPWDTRAVAPWA